MHQVLWCATLLICLHTWQHQALHLRSEAHIVCIGEVVWEVPAAGVLAVYELFGQVLMVEMS
jgi:hypothetical protein